VNKLLSLPKVSEALGLRDKVILELLYACGLRVSELINVKISDIFFDDHLIRVIGKRNKERIVPIHSAALQWIKNYLLNSRPALQKKIQSKNFLLLNRRGTKLSRMGIWMIIDQYTSQLKVKAHPHTFRHTFATHLVEGGADLRSVQEMLGHTDIATTSIYTHIDNAFVKKEHINAHPRGR
jgi:integrase/recombinase XerD